jgi:hypothetical protein
MSNLQEAVPESDAVDLVALGQTKWNGELGGCCVHSLWEIPRPFSGGGFCLLNKSLSHQQNHSKAATIECAIACNRGEVSL